MALSTRFPVSVHILTILAAKCAMGEDAYVSAAFIARSVATNRVVVSRILSRLNSAGLIKSQHGLRGGAKLAHEPADITLLDIFKAVEDAKLAPVHEPHPKCPLAGVVKKSLQHILGRAELAFEASLQDTTLAEVAKPSIEALKEFKS